MKRQQPEVGSLFIVPLPDGSGALGQIVGREASVLNSWTCAFSRLRVPKKESTSPPEVLRADDIISVQFVTGELLKNGTWIIQGKAPVGIPKSDFPHENLRSQGWVGAKVRGSGNIRRFLAAFHGLEFWDGMKDPDYYQKLLLSRIQVPHEIKRKTA